MANSSRTVAQEAAYNAGLGFASGKANKRVTVKLENQDAFRDGVKKGRSIIAKGKAAKPATQSKVVYSREDKIKHYSALLSNPKATAGQRRNAVKRLRELAK